jgi:hypothetical protein
LLAPAKSQKSSKKKKKKSKEEDEDEERNTKKKGKMTHKHHWIDDYFRTESLEKTFDNGPNKKLEDDIHEMEEEEEEEETLDDDAQDN